MVRPNVCLRQSSKGAHLQGVCFLNVGAKRLSFTPTQPVFIEFLLHMNCLRLGMQQRLNLYQTPLERLKALNEKLLKPLNVVSGQRETKHPIMHVVLEFPLYSASQPRSVSPF